MPPLDPYLADKNTLVQKGYKMCVEFLVDKTAVSPADWVYFRRARYDIDITANIDQLGNPGTMVDAVFEGGSPIGDVEESHSLQNEAPAMQLTLPNAARELESILEFYDLTLMPGRLLWIHPDHPDEIPAAESVFVIMGSSSVGENAVLHVSPFQFDTTATLLPRTQVRVEDWPGLAGARRRFLA